MSGKDFPVVSRHDLQEPSRPVLSRAPARHRLVIILLGVLCAAAIFGLLWLLYALG
jgi:hypothetical protein